MIAIDTNVLVRYLVKDDAVQYLLAKRLIEDQLNAGVPVMVGLLVVLETEWVLRRAYRYSKPDISSTLMALLAARAVMVEDEAVLERALLFWNLRAVNFANCLILAKGAAAGANALLTFDKRAAKLPACQLLR